MDGSHINPVVPEPDSTIKYETTDYMVITSTEQLYYMYHGDLIVATRNCQY